MKIKPIKTHSSKKGGWPRVSVIREESCHFVQARPTRENRTIPQLHGRNEDCRRGWWGRLRRDLPVRSSSVQKRNFQGIITDLYPLWRIVGAQQDGAHGPVPLMFRNHGR